MDYDKILLEYYNDIVLEKYGLRGFIVNPKERLLKKIRKYSVMNNCIYLYQVKRFMVYLRSVVGVEYGAEKKLYNELKNFVK